MEYFKLESEHREGSGKGIARKLRKQGKVPGILYGHGEKPICLFLEESDLRKMFHTQRESTIVDLSIGGKRQSSLKTIVREVQRHPASGALLHIDFQRIKMDEQVRVQVPILLLGDPRGVKEMGGILEHGLRELNISCIPAAIPDAVEIDVTGLEIGDSIHVRDVIQTYPNIDFLDDEETTLASIVPPKVEVAPVAEEVAEEPELVSEEEEEKEGDEGASEKD